ncbi:MAG: polyprenyl synthetase family protein [Planctomycetota bacterium]
MESPSEVHRSSANAEMQTISLQKIASIVAFELSHSEEHLNKFLSSQYAYVDALICHIERFKGKRLRPIVLHLSARAFGGEAPLASEVAALIEMIHLATLCHDDVLDDADTRRNVPTVNACWGNKSAVLTGDLLFSRVFEVLGKLDDGRVIRILSRISRQMCEGELLQIDNRFNVDMDENTYFELIEKKTAMLFGATAELGALLAGAKEADSRRLCAYGRRLGLAFQIVDDCLDLMGMEQTVGKSLGSDLKNGEFTLPIIHLLATTSGARKQELLNMLKPCSANLDRAALRPYLERTGSISYALQAARVEAQRARSEIEFLPPSSAQAALRDFPEYVLERTF